MFHFISLGVGVQSTTLALMAAHGEIEPMPDAAITADTQDESIKFYQQLKYLRSPGVLPFPVHLVTKGKLSDYAVERRTSSRSGRNYVRGVIPAFFLDENGNPGPSNRDCTREFKLEPILKKSKELAGIKTARGITEPIVTNWIGISRDEAQRMKPSRYAWAQNRYPLIELGMSRQDCLSWLRKHGYPEPARSACVFCPYRSREEWLAVKQVPEDWAAALAFESELISAYEEHDEVMRGRVSLLRSGERLEEADFENRDQFTLWDQFGNECEGMCGV